MRTIIAATDFTPSSINACHYAAMLASKLNCKLTLFSMFEAPLMHTNMGLYGLSYMSIKKNNEDTISKLAKDILKAYPKLVIEPFVTSGAFSLALKDFTANHQVVAAVMGLASKNWLIKSIYGSHGVNLAGKIETPVIIVPSKYKNHRLANMVLAVDNTEKLHQTSLKHFESLLKAMKIKLHVLHVKTKEEILAPVTTTLKFNGKIMPILQIQAKNLKSGIKEFCKKEQIDIIGIISKKHNILYNFYAESNTSKVAYNSSIPVLAIHE